MTTATSTHKASSQPTKEVVVIVHAARTTTSEQSQLDVITNPRRKLTTFEKETTANRLGLRVQRQLFKLAAAMLGVNVTGDSRMTMFIQLQPDSYVMMMGL